MKRFEKIALAFLFGYSIMATIALVGSVADLFEKEESKLPPPFTQEALETYPAEKEYSYGNYLSPTPAQKQGTGATGEDFVRILNTNKPAKVCIEIEGNRMYTTDKDCGVGYQLLKSKYE